MRIPLTNSIATPDQALRFIACPHVLSIEKDRLDVVRPVGGTITELLQSIGWTRDGLSARVYLDGVLVREAVWEVVVPHAGQALVVRAVPMGGEGGGKDATRIVAMIGVLALAFAAPYAIPGLVGTLGGAALSAAVSIVGTLAISALIPPARPKLDDLSGLSTSSNTLSLNGTQNQLIPYGVVPRVYGRHRIFPPLAARHYTEVVGDRQFLRALFCFGPGPLALSDFKIGENLLELFTDVETEVRQGYPTDPPHTLYPAVVSEEPLSIPIVGTGSYIRTSKDSATELSVDVAFIGLYYVNQGTVLPWTVALRVEYRLQGDTAWTLVNGSLPVQATLTTALAGTNNDLVFTEVGTGSFAGNNYTIQYLDPGSRDRTTEALGATWNGTGIAFVVTLRRVAGLYSTAAQVRTLLQSASFTLLHTFTGPRTFRSVITVTLAPGNDGSGRVVPMSPTHLQGGRNEVGGFTVTESRTTQFKKSLSWHTDAPGIYEVQLTRLTADQPPPVQDEVFWTALRTVRAGVQLIPSGMASVAIRIKATDQLHGTLDAFNAMASSILPDWNGTDWVPQETSNPASIFRDVHQGTANARLKSDSRMDLVTLQAFHARCAAEGFQFNAILDFRSTVAEVGRDVLAAGRATPGYRDGQISCIEDLPQTIATQMLTPRNSWGFHGNKNFTDLPHALKVRFANAETLEQDERVVAADGYGVTGSDGIRRDAFGLPTTLPEATKFEAVEAGLGVNQPDQIFALQRYHLAVLTLRTETYQVSCDFEHLIMRPGDLVQVQHDVPLFGLLTGRIAALTVDAIGRTSTITLDEPCTMLSGERYGVRLRLHDGTQLQREVLTVPGEQTTLTLLEPV